MISTRDIVNIPYNIGDKLAVVSFNLGDEINYFGQLVEWRISFVKEQEEFIEELILKIEKQCMSNDPMKLLTAKEICEIFQELVISLNKKQEELYEEHSLKLAKQLAKQFANNDSTIAKESYERLQVWRIIFNKRQEEFNKQILKLEKEYINDPMKLLTAKEVYEQIKGSFKDELNEKHIKITNEFLEANKIIPTLSTISQKHQDTVYIRQPISSELINAILNAK
ncbi:9444_t:CDS:2 [Gigaspora rosea]|nr:9444_t:CDS:2 [Gigaspora rosea]